MLGHAPLSAAPLSAFVDTELVVFAFTDIILRLDGEDGDICLWIPGEADDCGGTGLRRSKGARITLESEDWRERQARQRNDDLLVVEILSHWLGRI